MASEGLNGTMTTVVNIKLNQAYDVYIGRAGKGESGYFGNPYTLERYGKRALELFTEYFRSRVESDQEFRRRVLALRDQRLGCFCVRRDGSGDCHGKIIAAWVDAEWSRTETQV